MDKGLLKQGELAEFIETLRLFGELHGPILSEAGVFAFSPISDPSQLRLDYHRTQIPPKKYLLPFREEILDYRAGIYRQSHHPPPEIILFGVHPCDLDGIAYLDRVFLGDSPDHCYAERRARLTLVGVSCVPDDHCFCSGSPDPPPCDLFMEAGDGGFRVEALSARGSEVADAAKELFSLQPSVAAAAPCRKGITAQDPQLRFSDNPLWDKFASTCVSCGACSVCCPTCYCFDVREYPSLDGGGIRLREWDNCLFVTHGEVAGANFRTSRLDRLRYRFLHKYCGFTPLQGMTSCVGCGRCKEVCPVDIDLREIAVGPDREGGPP